ncbi:hypothetical protein P154DRAFT_602590 [Amniculicola lignicola CBS 123094]|uniref:Uncharacterized protein n=1 Tax=Amniculicola lignicola CBS 123094 TaxID=1392246 RepID=A0A6A5WC95_9PLEO|nr:hypothetical protein P154DRAFT_602590 [Amniculicola lignicola CBS 123094]
MGPMRPKEFNELVNFGKKITDYEAQDEEGDEGQDLRQKMEIENSTETGRRDEVVDEGVAAVFDQDEDDNAPQSYEVRDDDTLGKGADAHGSRLCDGVDVYRSFSFIIITTSE